MSDVVQDLMAAFRLRRVQDVARLFDVRPTTVSMWRRRGLPSRHRLAAMRLARERGVELPESVADGRSTGPAASRSNEAANELRSRFDGRRGHWVRIDDQGRIAIPPVMLDGMGVKPGDNLLLEIEEAVLRIRDLRNVVSEIQARVRRMVPDHVSLADELIAERRREVEDE